MVLEKIRKNKIEQLENLKKEGINPYPIECRRSHRISSAVADFSKLAEGGKEIVLAGRIMAKREHGGSIFVNLYDGSGRIQVYFKKDKIGEGEFNLFKNDVGIGDFVEASGVLFATQKGEKTLEVREYRILAKSLLPMPEKWHGLRDVEERFRKRYLDLLFNDDVKENFIVRSKIMEALKIFFLKEGFLEVETPMLQLLAGGATANPFKTHLDALDLDLYLRIAPELYLKRLLIGGFEKVFEMGRNFRNEGMSREHNPEFTMLEAYAAYEDHEWLMNFVEKMIRGVTEKVLGKDSFVYGDNEIRLEKFERKEYDKLFSDYLNLDLSSSSDDVLIDAARKNGVVMEKGLSRANVMDELFKKIIRPKIIQPTFVVDYPVELSPLSKKLEDRPDRVARFQLLIAGSELLNAFSELNDPLDQKERFEEQERMRAQEKVPESHRYDKDFVEALEYGMPPAAGLGLGVDRLVMLLTNSHSMREVIFFPLMRPKK